MNEQRYVDGRAGIDAQLVARLIAAQLPQWRHLPVLPVEHDGWDSRSYRLGADMSVRLPTAAGYVPAVDKEHRWLPVLARSLPVPGWPAASGTGTGIGNQFGLATDVAGFIGALQRIDPTGGPAAGRTVPSEEPHSRITTPKPAGRWSR